MKKKNIFIFGENGFIGTHLKQLIFNNQKINLVNNKINLKKNIKNSKFYHSFWSKVIDQSNIIIYLSFNNDLRSLNQNISNSFRENLLPLYILNQIILKNKKNIKIVYTSTASLYSNNIKLPAKEKSKIKINNIYEFLKHSSEQIMIKSNNRYLDYQILRLSNVYGENTSKYSQNNRQVLTRVIQDAFYKKEINVFGTGNYYRDFVHVYDVCNAINKIILRNYSKNAIYNIASGKKLKLIDIFKEIKNFINKNYNISIKIKKIKTKKNNLNLSDFRNFQASISKAKRKILWSPKIKFQVGLKNLIKYVGNKKKN